MTTPLQQLARKVGLGTEYVAFNGQTKHVSSPTLLHILAAMGFDAETDQAQLEQLQKLDDAPWRRRLPTVTVLHNEEHKHLLVHVPHGADVSVTLTQNETDEKFQLEQVDHWVAPRQIDDVLVGRATFLIPAGLPLGWYQAHAISESAPNGADSIADVVVTPARANWDLGNGPLPLGQRWGAQAQLYACTSGESWGVGDFADLGLLAQLLADDGADFVLINPVHAANMVPKVTASPYSPTSRRFIDPQYLRPQKITEYSNLGTKSVAEVDALAAAAQQLNQTALLDRDASWKLKVEALWLLFTNGLTRSRAKKLEKFKKKQGQMLVDFARWNAAQDERFSEDFYCWLQMCCREQLAAAQTTARQAGMSLGVIQDLAVGVDSRSADSELLGSVLTQGAHVGAPPDMYNQLGQDWGQPPWHPLELEQQSYKPLWDVLTSSIESAGGLRIDHILGFFRLWWVPKGLSPEEGAYVYYDHEAMIGLALLAVHQSAAVLIGEDLGTFDPWVADYLASRGLLGTTIYFFENDGGCPRPTAYYRQQALASVTTHDLPPSAGYLEGEHIRLRGDLGLLVTSVEDEEVALAAQRAGLVDKARELGVVPQDKMDLTTEELVIAAHQDLLGAPSRLLGVSLVDLVGQRQVQNQPGTSWQYTNWCVPLANPQQRVSLEQLKEQPPYRAIVGLF